MLVSLKQGTDCTGIAFNSNFVHSWTLQEDDVSIVDLQPRLFAKRFSLHFFLASHFSWSYYNELPFFLQHNKGIIIATPVFIPATTWKSNHHQRYLIFLITQLPKLCLRGGNWTANINPSFHYYTLANSYTMTTIIFCTC